MSDIEVKATNGQTRKTTKNSQTQNTGWQLPEEKGVSVIKEARGQIHGDVR